jgi:hypothetical protein
MPTANPLKSFTPLRCPRVDTPETLAAPTPPSHPPPMPRNPRQGLTTLATLAAVLLLAVLTLTFQTRTAADRRLLVLE